MKRLLLLLFILKITFAQNTTEESGVINTSQIFPLANVILTLISTLMIGRIYKKDFNFVSDCFGGKIAVESHSKVEV